MLFTKSEAQGLVRMKLGDTPFFAPRGKKGRVP